MTRKGGSRTGSGRKCIKPGKNKRLHVKISTEAYDMLVLYSDSIDISISDIIELWIDDNCRSVKEKEA